MTRTKIRDLVRKKLGETTAAFWTDAELNGWIDEAGHDLAFETKSIRSDGYINTVASTEEYSLSTNFPTLISVSEVYLYQNGTTWLKLDPINRADLNKLYPGWKSAPDGTPTMYYWVKEEDMLGLYVPPNSTNAGTQYLRVYYAKDYTNLASDEDSPALPTYLHQAVVIWVTATGYETRGYGEKANDAWQKYYARVASYYKELQRERDDEEIIMKPERNIW